MRITFDFESEQNIVLPVNYQNYLHGLIYSNISNQEVRSKLHDEGIIYNGNKFKHFTFSRLLGSFEYDGKRKTLNFGKKVRFVFSTKLEDVESDILHSLFTKEELSLGGNKIKLSSIEASDKDFENNKEKESWNIQMLSPLTVFSRYENVLNGKNRTVYFSPKSKELSGIISSRLKRKYLAYYKTTNGLDFNITITPLSKESKVVAKLKGNEFVEAYDGRFEISGHPEVLKFAYDVGIGKKNSFGFGMFEKLS